MKKIKMKGIKIFLIALIINLTIFGLLLLILSNTLTKIIKYSYNKIHEIISIEQIEYRDKSTLAIEELEQTVNKINLFLQKSQEKNKINKNELDRLINNLSLKNNQLKKVYIEYNTDSTLQAMIFLDKKLGSAIYQMWYLTHYSDRLIYELEIINLSNDLFSKKETQSRIFERITEIKNNIANFKNRLK